MLEHLCVLLRAAEHSWITVARSRWFLTNKNKRPSLNIGRVCFKISLQFAVIANNTPVDSGTCCSAWTPTDAQKFFFVKLCCTEVSGGL